MEHYFFNTIYGKERLNKQVKQFVKEYKLETPCKVTLVIKEEATRYRNYPQESRHIFIVDKGHGYLGLTAKDAGFEAVILTKEIKETMDALKVFEYQENQIRTVLVNDEPWFVAKDVCEILEIQNSTDAVKRLDEDEVARFNLGGLSGVTNIVNEYGLYSLILGSRKSEAKMFKRWITHEVIPSIRKTGQYIVTPKSYVEALEALLNSEKEKILLLEQNESMKPKAEMYDVLLSADNAQPMGEVAKAFGWGRNKLFALLRDRGILMKNNLPYQRYVDSEQFEVREVTTTRGDSTINVAQTLVTPKGIDFIGKILKECAS